MTGRRWGIPQVTTSRRSFGPSTTRMRPRNRASMVAPIIATISCIPKRPSLRTWSTSRAGVCPSMQMPSRQVVFSTHPCFVSHRPCRENLELTTGSVNPPLGQRIDADSCVERIGNQVYHGNGEMGVGPGSILIAPPPPPPFTSRSTAAHDPPCLNESSWRTEDTYCTLKLCLSCSCIGPNVLYPKSCILVSHHQHCMTPDPLQRDVQSSSMACMALHSNKPTVVAGSHVDKQACTGGVLCALFARIHGMRVCIVQYVVNGKARRVFIRA